jgi:hypothetical protein
MLRILKELVGFGFIGKLMARHAIQLQAPAFLA